MSPFRTIGVYCAGWLQSGPVGVILSTMTDAFTTANHIFQDIQNSVIRCEKSKPGYELIKPILRERGKKINLLENEEYLMMKFFTS